MHRLQHEKWTCIRMAFKKKSFVLEHNASWHNTGRWLVQNKRKGKAVCEMSMGLIKTDTHTDWHIHTHTHTPFFSHACWTLSFWQWNSLQFCASSSKTLMYFSCSRSLVCPGGLSTVARSCSTPISWYYWSVMSPWMTVNQCLHVLTLWRPSWLPWNKTKPTSFQLILTRKSQKQNNTVMCRRCCR